MHAFAGPTRLGFGVSGPHATRLVAPDKTVDLISRAATAGVRLFDIAPFYGDGEAERRLGLALSKLDRDTVFVCSKVGTIWRGWGRAAKNFEPEFVRRSFFQSLKRLGLERLDAFLLHGPAPEALTPALLETLTGLKAAGWVDYLGVCVRGRELEPALDAQAFDMVMAPVRADITAQGSKLVDLLIRARADGVAVIGIEALAPAGRRPLHMDGPGLWRMAKTMKSRGASAPSAMTPTQALQGAFETGLADAIMMTTTRSAHLDANIALAKALNAADTTASEAALADPKPGRETAAIGRGRTA
ncbi:MAG: aldo/keto reductase [Maricaulaceae bacterium]